MNRTLMVGAVLTAVALAGCGGATQTASETASAPGAAAASSPGAASQSAQSGRSSHSAQSDQSTQAGRAERSAQPGGSTKPARSAQSATPEPVTKSGQATKPGRSTTSGQATQSAKPAPPADAGMAFTAYGRNTPWRAVVRKGTLTTEGPSVGEHTLRVTRSAWSKGVRFTGSEGGQKFSLVVRPGTCVDGSGQNTGQVATLSVGNRQLSGCAVSGAYPRANT